MSMLTKTILVTGATSGIGRQTALALAQSGAQVIITGRNQVNGQVALDEMRQLSGSQNIDLLLADLSTQAGIRSLAEQVKQKYDRLDVLINNAGLAASERTLTIDGLESMYAVNVIAPYLLTRLLMDRLELSPSARVICVSGGEHPAKIEMDNLQAEHSFLGLKTYSHAKLVMMALMKEFSLGLAGTPVTVNVCYPGQASTNMTQSVTAQMLPGGLRLMWPLFKLMIRPDGGRSAARASRSSVYLATSKEVEGVNGKYFDSHSKMVAWPAAVLDPTIRQQILKIAEMTCIQ